MNASPASNPSLTIVMTEIISGAVFLVLAFANAVTMAGDVEPILAVGLGAVGGGLIGQGVGMARHRRPPQRAD